MFITSEEFRRMGFDWEDDSQLEKAISRAEFVILALSDGRASAAIAAGGTAAQYIKHAAALQTLQILQNEYSDSGAVGSRQEERVSVGDFSYSSSVSTDGSVSQSLLDTGATIVGLLRSAGCLFSGLEAAQ